MEKDCIIVERSYAILGQGCMCWDATSRYNQIGRYLIHVQKLNTKLSRPYHVWGKWRIEFVAVRDIEAGDEVMWDYRMRGQEWSVCRLLKGVVRGGNQNTNQDEEVNLYEDARPGPSTTLPSDVTFAFLFMSLV